MAQMEEFAGSPCWGLGQGCFTAVTAGPWASCQDISASQLPDTIVRPAAQIMCWLEVAPHFLHSPKAAVVGSQSQRCSSGFHNVESFLQDKFPGRQTEQGVWDPNSCA